MIATLKGKVIATTEQSIVVEVNGVGFSVMVTPAIRLSVSEGKEIFLHTALLVREDALTLFGYHSISEREFFLLLQTVSGIGPKVSHGALSTLSITQLIRAISSGDSKTLEQISGLGKKGAQRIILELKEKVDVFRNSINGNEPADLEESNGGSGAPNTISVAEALAGLGFGAREIDQALEIVKVSNAQTLEEKLRVALSALQNGGPRG
jgi:Holliday junction DNA helicase RuvA